MHRHQLEISWLVRMDAWSLIVRCSQTSQNAVRMLVRCAGKATEICKWRTFAQVPHHLHRARLPEPVRAADRLRLPRVVPVRLEDEDVRGDGEVEADCAARLVEQEDWHLWVVVELLHQRLLLLQVAAAHQRPARARKAVKALPQR